MEVVHNASIMSAAGVCGLQLYNFGQTVSIPFFNEDWKPDSFYAKMKYNQGGGMHTLCLLGAADATIPACIPHPHPSSFVFGLCFRVYAADIKVKEPDFEAMVMGKKKYLPPRFMTVNRALEQLLEIEEKHGEGVITKESLCVGLARVGQDTQQIVAGTAEELLKIDFGEPLHSLVVVGEMHELEADMLKHFAPRAEVASGAGEA